MISGYNGQNKNGKDLYSLFMKHTNKILALLTAALLLLSNAGCLVPKSNSSSAATDAPNAQTTAPASTNAADTTDYDPDATAIELGSVKITVGEIETMFDQYVSFYSYGYGLDEETLDQFMRMSEEYLIEYYLPIWKAEQLGVTLSEEEEAEITALAESAKEEERTSIILLFAEDTYEGEEALTDVSMLTDEQLQAVLADIDAAVVEYYGDGFTFDDYLELVYQDSLVYERSDRLTALLQKNAENAYTVSQEDVDAWYETALDEQRTKYDATPAEFWYDADDPETLILYVPEGYARVQVIEFVPDGEPDPAIASNKTAMQALEAEYGALALSGENPERQEAIKAEYAALKAENEALEDAYYGEVRASAEEAYKKLQDGEAFDGSDERLVYLNGVDPFDPGIAEIAKTLTVGAYSEPLPADGSYVIVKLIELLPAGVVDRASIEAQIAEAAVAEQKDELWEAQFDEWFEEAKEAAVYHRDAYEYLIDYYAQSYDY